MSRLLIENIGMLATPNGSAAKRGAAQGQIQTLNGAWILAVDGKIEKVGTGKSTEYADRVIDAKGCLVTPGLVDAHTHLIFGGWRQNELAMKIRNVPYLEILAAGGGILSTVNASHAATEEELTLKAEAALDEMLRFGTTTCEAKSGYGLDTKEELKQLRVIRNLNERHPMDLAATFLGAHALPPAFKTHREDYIMLLCEEMIPEVAVQKLAKFCDVFCETGVILVAVGVYSANDDASPDTRAITAALTEIVAADPALLQYHGLYVDEEQHTARFDLVVSFDVPTGTTRHETWQRALDEMQRRFPAYAFTSTMDSDLSD